LRPDVLTIGKAIGGGVPVAAYGFGETVAGRLHAMVPRDSADTGGIGGTLAANALSLAATRATLEHVLTGPNFAHMTRMAEAWAAGVQGVIDQLALGWHVTRLGCRAEYWYRAQPMRNGSEAAASYRAELDEYLHLAALNRGILMTPFHNMALMCPATTLADVDRHTTVFEEIVSAIVAD
jgi:glutamate-1-semialdehyde 2,1-aminomutase